MPDITVKKHSAWVWVNLDEDGTPLNLRGERMVEISPGQWVEPLTAWLMEHFERHPIDGDHR